VLKTVVFVPSRTRETSNRGVENRKVVIKTKEPYKMLNVKLLRRLGYFNLWFTEKVAH